MAGIKVSSIALSMEFFPTTPAIHVFAFLPNTNVFLMTYDIKFYTSQAMKYLLKRNRYVLYIMYFVKNYVLLLCGEIEILFFLIDNSSISNIQCSDGLLFVKTALHILLPINNTRFKILRNLNNQPYCQQPDSRLVMDD